MRPEAARWRWRRSALREPLPVDAPVLMGRRLRAPDLLEARVASAAVPVEAVAERVLLVVVLVVFLGAIEGARGDDLRLHRDAELLLHRGEGGLGGLPLRGVVDEDRRAVLGADVAELPIGDGGVDVVPVDVEELLEADPRRVVDDLDRLGVAGAARGHLLVAGVGLGASRVAGRDRDDAGEGLEGRLHAPEADAREGGDCRLSARGAAGGGGRGESSDART